MSNETKRDVFDDLVEELADACIALDGEGIGDGFTNEDKQAYLKDYDDALPDDLPVIPKKVSSWIEYCYGSTNLLGILLKAMETYRTSEVMAWVVSHHESVALAWVLGAWRVEETGEIVKLEAEE